MPWSVKTGLYKLLCLGLGTNSSSDLFSLGAIHGNPLE